MAASVIDFMQSKEYKILEMKAYESFIRRASQINLPFMLKGSYVTRQYFQNPNNRIPADLDWVYMETIKDESTARQMFNEWATLVTELELDDNVRYSSFKENEFWRRIDYAMADDFPTVNTDIECFVNGERLVFGLDISFNLDIEQPPVSLMYQALEGEPFLVPNTAPISLQISWKIHQTLIRPRFKDLFDLMYLVQHSTFDKVNFDNSIQALINECSADNVDLVKLKYFLNYEIDKLFPKNSIDETWALWRHNIDKRNYSSNIPFDKADFITDATKLPTELTEFIGQFKVCLESAGFVIQLFYNLPKPSRNKRKTFADSLINTSIKSSVKDEIENGKHNTGTISNFLRKMFK